MALSEWVDNKGGRREAILRNVSPAKVYHDMFNIVSHCLATTLSMYITSLTQSIRAS